MAEEIAHAKNKLDDKKKPPGGFDKTPLPNVPPGYTVRITFIRATNVPPADVRSYSSDPFVYATLRAPGLPRRHKEDPDLTHQTPTVRTSTEPEWNDVWTVANVPASGFSLRCRLLDEDYPDKNDRLGHVMVTIPSLWAAAPASDDPDALPSLGDEWRQGKALLVKKRTGSKRVYAIRGCMSLVSRNVEMTPRLVIALEVVGRSDPPHGQMYTAGPTYWIKHNSPMIGRITGTKVNADENDDVGDAAQEKRKIQRYDFQANEMQLAGPVPPELYHRYVEFRPIIGSMFSRRGLAGRLLNKALHKQHSRIYNFDKSTERALFEPRSQDAALQFLRMAHFDEGARLFTYVLTLDGMLRFTETGGEFGIDLLSKHSMHSDVATYIACSGEFFIRRRQPSSPASEPHLNPGLYTLYIDNDSGTYRPDQSVLPSLRSFLEREFPGLTITTNHWADKDLQALKKDQVDAKRRDRPVVNMVLNSSPSSSSLSSDASRLDDMEGPERSGTRRRKAKVERAIEALEHPRRIGAIVAAGGFVDEPERGGSSRPANADRE